MIIGFLFITLIAALPGQVSAESDDDECISIVVIKADYLDYDNDGYEDDIITIFKVIPPANNDWKKGRINIECKVEKPSGDSLSIEFEVYTNNGVEITIVWFDWADESGYYILYIEAGASDDEYDWVESADVEHVFDPPGGSDPGPPVIAIMYIDEL